MKSFALYFILFICLLCCFRCKTANKNGQKSTDLITIKTLGLAYLEEFKLEEAEQQFLKFIDLAPKEKLGYANLGLVYLRMAKYPEAEENLLKAIKIDPKDADIKHTLAIVYKMQDKPEKAINQLLEALRVSPDHVRVLYDLTDMYSIMQDTASKRLRESYMIKLTEIVPANLVPRLELTDIYIRNGNFDKAIEQLEVIKKQYPEFPKEAVEYYKNTLELLRKSKKEEAIIQFTIFHNYLKVSSPYQAGIVDLKGPGGSLIGFPIISFDKQASVDNLPEGSSILDAIKFVDITETCGLDIVSSNSKQYSDIEIPTHVQTGDYDGDGDIDIYAGSYDNAGAQYKHYLFSNEMSRFIDITAKSGIKHKDKEYSATFADYDNDGYLDLYVLTEAGGILYRNTDKGTFEDVTSKSEIKDKNAGNKSVFFDIDHDGDLDIYELKNGPNSLFRNNADGTFLEQAVKMGITGGGDNTGDAVFCDFDEDGDIDLIVANNLTGLQIFSNQRQGIFKDITKSSGVPVNKGANTITAGDYNNDGYIDLFVGLNEAGKYFLLINQRNATYKVETNKSQNFSSLNSLKILDASFLDFDNDGFSDLLVAGKSTNKDGKGLFLFHNNGKADFNEVKDLLPEKINPVSQLTVFDYNDDGDLDILYAGLYGGIHLLRNDGGNNNHFIKMKLVGLKAGSAKNNYFGIGAKVEVRAGELYQTQVVTDPDVHFGIGNRKQADIIRITWTNGVPQNIFMPGSDQSIVESQTLKGSCPFLYVWNGKEYAFVKDILWRSALGMPLGIMGGTTAYAFSDASDDYIKIPGNIVKPKNNKISIQITSELWETIYLDKLEFIAVDHPADIDIFVPEQFTPPPFPGKKIYQCREKHLPLSVFDSNGNNLINAVSKKDDYYISYFTLDKYQGVTEMKDLIIDPGKNINASNFILYLNGWIFPTDASINIALSQSDNLKVIPPSVQLINKNGEWQTVASDISFPMGKDKTVIVDLSDKFLSDDYRIRIRTNMEIYWDHIFFSENEYSGILKINELKRTNADLHYRGFSSSFRKGGRYGPHWFDYNEIQKEPKWRDLKGNYTRYGDVNPLLSNSDNQYIISNAGDEVTVEYDIEGLPELQKGWKRDYLIRSVGWVKDGDLNTAFGNTVTPLPFHGMKYYSPQKFDEYPNSPELQRYNREYNTRIVSAERYINALKELTDNSSLLHK